MRLRNSLQSWGLLFWCADLELHQEPREDKAAYIANWLEVLKNDNRTTLGEPRAPFSLPTRQQ